MRKRGLCLIVGMLAMSTLLGCAGTQVREGTGNPGTIMVLKGSRTILSGPGTGSAVNTTIEVALDGNTVKGFSDSDLAGTYAEKDGNYKIKVKGRIEKKGLNFTLKIEGRFVGDKFTGTFIQSFDGDTSSQKGTIELLKT